MNTTEFFTEHATAEPWHVARYVHSAEWIPLADQDCIFDAGGESPFSAWLNSEGVQVTHTAADLRYAIPLDSEIFDGATCMEVIEHLKDQDHPDNRDTFDGSGIQNLLAELLRITKRGGWLFLSTPNACGERNIHRMLVGHHPYMYPPHHRELAPRDVLAYIKEAGWRIERHELLTVWGTHVPSPAREAMHKFVRQYYGKTHSMHGDCLFVLARKL